MGVLAAFTTGWKDASCRSPSATDTLAQSVKELPQ